ncbi:hypothetical protein D6792_00005 [Candidatus Parcubacteria bacterium]|nr:MAG: hypothetical protein D6792_00005 [Candidatus Parcubacteria bacterium]
MPIVKSAMQHLAKHLRKMMYTLDASIFVRDLNPVIPIIWYAIRYWNVLSQKMSLSLCHYC